MSSKKPHVTTEESFSSQSPSPTQQTTSKPWWSPESPSESTEETSTTDGSKPTTSKPWWSPSTEDTEFVETHPTTESSVDTEKPETPSSEPDVTNMDSCTFGEYYPVKDDCNSYYRCILSTLKKESCAPGLHWNKKNKICDWPMSAQCEDKSKLLAHH